MQRSQNIQLETEVRYLGVKCILEELNYIEFYILRKHKIKALNEAQFDLISWPHACTTMIRARIYIRLKLKSNLV